MVYAIAMTNISIFKSDRSDLKLLIKGRTIRKLIGGGGGGGGGGGRRSTKRIFA